MPLHGFPIAADLPSDPSIKDRFWYWQGASGRKYIHSVYAFGRCPPLPGAIYLAVRRDGNSRLAVGIGRFAPFWDGPLSGQGTRALVESGVDEIHVHLLAKSPVVAEAILADLKHAFDGEPSSEPSRTFSQDAIFRHAA